MDIENGKIVPDSPLARTSKNKQNHNGALKLKERRYYIQINSSKDLSVMQYTAIETLYPAPSYKKTGTLNKLSLF